MIDEDATAVIKDAIAVDVSTFDNQDANGMGPNIYSQVAIGLGATPASSGGLPATYELNAPDIGGGSTNNQLDPASRATTQGIDTLENAAPATVSRFERDITPVVTSGVLFRDDFELDRGWRRNPGNRDTATTGQWEVANPEPTNYGSVAQQLGETVSGVQALVTQAQAGSLTGSYDIDNGLTSVRSPDIVLRDDADFRLEFDYYLAHLFNADNDDFLRVTVLGTQTSQVVLEERGNSTNRAAAWTDFSTDISSFAGETIAILVEAQDGGTRSLVEAAIDDLVIKIAPRDTEAPTPSLTARNITAEGTTTYEFEVTYQDDTAVDILTIGTGDIRVTGPNDYRQIATFIGVDDAPDGTSWTATYRLTAPDGLWNGDDKGFYRVFLEPNQVSDRLGNSVATITSLGDFLVDLSSDSLPLGNLGSGVAVRDDAAGMGYLMHSRELLEVRFLADMPAAENANNLIAVQYVDGQWYYDNDSRLVAFTPRSTDRLLAELDFSSDTATLLRSTQQTINGISAGYADGDLVITPNRWDGDTDPGEFGLSGTQVTLFGSGGDIPGQLMFDASTVVVDEAVGTINLTVDRVGGSDGQITVDYSTADVSATAGEDYRLRSGTLTFDPGETQKTLSIEIIDDAIGEAEEAFFVTLTNATGNASIGLASTVVQIVENDGGPEVQNPDDLLPDLLPIANTSGDYQIDTRQIPGQVLLRLSTEVANVGAGPLELWGTPTSGRLQPVFQRIYDRNGGFRDELAGEFVNHPSHGHFHFEGFAEYNLRTINADGSPGTIVASGGKTSFCLININHRFPDLTDAAVVADGRGGDDCGLVQGVDVGYADVYGRHLPDQWIDVTDIADGDYWLEVTSDPDNNILETDETNNTDYLRITLDNPRF